MVWHLFFKQLLIGLRAPGLSRRSVLEIHIDRINSAFIRSFPKLSSFFATAPPSPTPTFAMLRVFSLGELTCSDIYKKK